jgi:hypothetical protein
MPLTRKNNTHKRAKKTPPAILMVKKSHPPIEEAIFPEKIKKVKNVLSKSNFRPS